MKKAGDTGTVTRKRAGSSMAPMEANIQAKKTKKNPKPVMDSQASNSRRYSAPSLGSESEELSDEDKHEIDEEECADLEAQSVESDDEHLAHLGPLQLVGALEAESADWQHAIDEDFDPFLDPSKLSRTSRKASASSFDSSASPESACRKRRGCCGC